MINEVDYFLRCVGVFYIIYLLIYVSYIFMSVVLGALRLYKRDKMIKIKNELKHEYYVPVSVLVPAYNEELTIADSVKSLLQLDYKLYEIIIIDDGSTDDTAKNVIDSFEMKSIDRPIHRKISCKPQKAVYECSINNVSITLISKENGGKGDSLNMGINASKYPYFLCLDADSFLQKNSLERIVQPILEDDSVVAVGGMVRIAQCAEIKDGEIVSYRLPKNPIACMQVLEYDRSFLASRILLDQINGNLIISGAFGLFRKEEVVAAGGYDDDTLGEDMELVVKLHAYCRNINKKYSIRYEPGAICWSQAPTRLVDLMKQRKRWHLGLFQSMVKYKYMFFNLRFGLVSISYMYYLFYELLSPIIEIFGFVTMLLAMYFGLLNVRFMLTFLILYGVYGSLMTLIAFYQRIYTQALKISIGDGILALFMCLLENIFFRYVISFIRMTAFFNYKKNKRTWGSIKRERHNNAE